MERCPCCNARLREVVVCPRCKADLWDIINSEHQAKFWFSKAIHYWMEKKIKESIDTLELSIHLKRMEVAVVFRDFIIQQLVRSTLDMLTQKHLSLAKKQLYEVRNIFPYSVQLRQMNAFADYLFTMG